MDFTQVHPEAGINEAKHHNNLYFLLPILARGKTQT